MLDYDDVEVLQINETIEGRGPSPANAMRAMDAESVKVSATPVQPGMVETGVSISITYELVDDEEES